MINCNGIPFDYNQVLDYGLAPDNPTDLLIEVLDNFISYDDHEEEIFDYKSQYEEMEENYLNEQERADILTDQLDQANKENTELEQTIEDLQSQRLHLELL